MAEAVSIEPAYAIMKNDQVGRYLVANRDLIPGEEILSVEAFVIGPKAFSYPLCLSCYAPWPPTEDSRPLCAKCGWPVCNENCENLAQHRDYECQVFAAVGEKFNVESALDDSSTNGTPQLECITPLRLLLQSEKQPEIWNSDIANLEAHEKARSTTKQWKIDGVNVVNYLIKRLKLERFNEQTIQNICGILEINTHEVRLQNGRCEARGLYPKISLINHSCVANTIHSITNDGSHMRLRARVRIIKGTELTGNYTASLLPTLVRREQLLEGKHFFCACPRCSDPTELGTQLSSLKCTKCDNGVVLPLDSLDADSPWKCTHCEFTTNGQAVRRVFRIIQTEVDAAEEISGAEGAIAIQARETVVKKYHSVLHPRHAFLTTLKYSLCQLYGRVEDYQLDDLPDVVLEHKVDMCRQLMQVLDVVEPGYSRMRGMILYELHVPLLFLAKSQWNAGVIDDAGLKSKMTEAANILKEATTILSYESPETTEGQIAIGAGESLNQLNRSIDDL